MNNHLNQPLLDNIKNNLPSLKKLHEHISSEWCAEDYFYRFYHHSYKIYNIQELTKDIINALDKLHPANIELSLNKMFLDICFEGTNKEFTREVNKEWAENTKPLIDAFLHAKYFLELIIKYGEDLEQAPESLPSGWAAILHLYNMR